MKKFLLVLGLVFSLVSCDNVPNDLSDLPQHNDVGEVSEDLLKNYVELEHYFDENGNPLPQKELHEKLVRKYNNGQLYSYREARNEAIELIKYFEGFEPKKYTCPSGKTTLGYGLTGKYIKGRKTITKAEAEHDLKLIYDEIYTNIENRLGRRLNENKMASLVSFAFNLGEEGLYSSTMFKMLVEGNENVSKEFIKFVYAKNYKTGKMEKMKGLENRRISEINLFNI